MKLAVCAALAFLIGTSAQTPVLAQEGSPLTIVAAENFYGDVAQQLAGPHAKVTSILSNPDEDPHLFEASPSVARALAGARIAVYNGVDYDPWMAKLLGASTVANRQVIVVADLLHRATGSNPHLWYDPATMPAYAQALSAGLVAADPAHKADYDQRLQTFLGTLTPLQTRIAGLRRKYAGLPVTATEPVFGYMAAALGLDMRNEHFQLAVMNNTEPSATDVAAMETDLKQHRVKLFIYNSQATDTAAERLLRIARVAKVPYIGVTETEPKGRDYQQWMLSQLDALDRALSAHS
jgi:zinc/manganese transport system substrate-binding protein